MKTSFFVNCSYTYACYHNTSTLNVIICSKLTIKTSELCHWRRSGVFTVNFKHISHLFPVSIVEFEQVNVSWIMILPKLMKNGEKGVGNHYKQAWAWFRQNWTWIKFNFVWTKLTLVWGQILRRVGEIFENFGKRDLSQHLR